MSEGALSESRTESGQFAPEPKWSDWAYGCFLSLLIALVFALIFAKASTLLIKPVPGTQMISEAMVCDANRSKCLNDGDFNLVQLPHNDRAKTTADFRYWHYRLTFIWKAEGDASQSLYLPFFSETVDIDVNGEELERMPHFYNEQSRRWARPEIYNLPKLLLRPGVNQLDIKLAGYAKQWSNLFPIYVGSSIVLQKQYDFRYWMTRGASRTSLFLMIINIAILGSLWFARRKSPLYLWLIVASVGGIIMMFAFSFDVLGISLSRRMWLIATGSALFSFALTKFYAIYTSIDLRRIIAVNALVLVCLLLLFPFMHFKLTANFIVLLTGMGFVFSLFIPGSAWVYRSKISSISFVMMFFVFLFITACFVVDYSTFALPERVATMSTIQFIPIFFMIIVLCLVGSQLLDALKKSEQLGASLKLQVEAKTAELEASFAELVASRRQQTISDERQRIMLDLHDGIGGQLVNTLAYMKSSELNDPTLKNALEVILQDLGLMIDSIEDANSVSTLLGMFRLRIEPLLAKQNVRFIWKIGDEPVMPDTGPSQNLTLLRIMQEAVTNSIKHSGGDEITVYTDDHSVSVSDNGKGFQPNKGALNSEKPGGIGLISMRRRATAINAEFDISSDKNGTEVTLRFPKLVM